MSNDSRRMKRVATSLIRFMAPNEGQLCRCRKAQKPFVPILESFEPRVLLDGLTPAQICAAYGLDQVSFTTTAGTFPGDGGSGLTVSQRPTVAIIDPGDDPNAIGDMNVFSDQNHLPHMYDPGDPNNPGNNPIFEVVGAEGAPTSGIPIATNTWLFEETLDVQVVHAIAPWANIMLVEQDPSRVGCAESSRSAAADCRCREGSAHGIFAVCVD